MASSNTKIIKKDIQKHFGTYKPFTIAFLSTAVVQCSWASNVSVCTLEAAYSDDQEKKDDVTFWYPNQKTSSREQHCTPLPCLHH